MANIVPDSGYPENIYQIETNDPVLGGAAGIANKQAKALAGRTVYLKQHVDDLEELTTEQGNTQDTHGGKIDALEDKMDTVLPQMGAPKYVLGGDGGVSLPQVVVSNTHNGMAIILGNLDAGMRFTEDSHDNFPVSTAQNEPTGGFTVFCHTAANTITKDLNVAFYYQGAAASGSLAQNSTGTITLNPGELMHVFLKGNVWYLHIVANKA